AVLEIMEKALAVPHRAEKELGVFDRDALVVLPIQMESRFSERAQHQPIPVGENFFVPAGFGAAFTYRIELSFGTIDLRLELFNRDLFDFAEKLRGARHVENILVFPISGLGDVKVMRHEFGVLTDDAVELVETPDVKLAFDSFAVRVLCGVKASV